MLISPSNLAAMGKMQKNIQTKVRPLGLININTKEYQIPRHLWKWSMIWLVEQHANPISVNDYR